MPNSSFDPGTVLLRNGEEFVVDSNGPRGVALRPKNPNVLDVVPAAQLTGELNSGTLVVKDLFFREAEEKAAAALPVPKALSDYPPKVRAVVAMRLAFLNEICPTGAMRCRRDLLGRALREFWSRLPDDKRDSQPPSESTFYEWRSRWKKSQFSDLSQIPRWDKRGRRPNAVPHALKVILERMTEEQYATGERPSVAEVLRLSCAEAAKQNRVRSPGDQIQMPTLAQMRRVIDSYDPERLLVRRYGKAAAHQRTRIYRAGPGALRLLERVEIDHTPLDIICVSSETHAPLGRPWATFMLDSASKMITGVWISFHMPNVNTVLRVLKQSILRKDELVAKYRLNGEWPTYGVPLALLMDNGGEFHGRALVAAAEDLGMGLDYCPSGEPRFKGGVERFMHTVLTGLIHRLPGTTFSNPIERGEYDSEAFAVLTIDELRELIFKWIVEVYSVTFHRGINAAPLQRWRELEKVCPPQMPKNIEALDTYLRPVETRSLSKKGIECNSLFYVAPELDELRRLNGLSSHDIKLLVRANPDDLGAIRVLHPKDDVYFTATCTRQDYAKGMTLEQHKFHKREAKRKYAKLGLLSGMLASKQEIREKVERALKLRRLNQRAKDATEAAVIAKGNSGGSVAPRGNGVKRPPRARKAAIGPMNGAGKDVRQMVETLAGLSHAEDEGNAITQTPEGADLQGDFESYDAIEAFGEREPELF